MTRSLLGAAAVSLLFVLSTWHATPALADPPPWARAEGWQPRHEGDDDEDYRRWRREREEERERHRHRARDEDRGYDAPPPPPPPVVVMAPPPPPPPPPMPYGLDQRICSRDLIGAALGGATGGLIGSNIGKGKGRTVATVGGVLVGLFVGGKIGRNMDQLDQACAGQALERVPDGQTVVWQGQNQDGYWVTPKRTYEASNGDYCREYTSEAVIAGRRQQTYGTACRQPDGSWQIIK
jgi:surface antigen